MLPAFVAKLCPRAELQPRLAELARPLVFTNGVFDILHRGHVTYLAQARARGASLVLGSTATPRRAASARRRAGRSTTKATARPSSPRSRA
jgi:bifunctional ADP-heptose synthase (sugar kinase/adenylyltransferase)